MTELQQNRYDQLLRRVGGLIGAKSMVNDALGELFPTIDVENLPAELQFLTGTKLGVGHSEQSASVGDFDLAQLFNPADSGNIVTPTLIMMRSTVSQSIRYAMSEVAMATNTNSTIQRDGRAGSSGNTVAEVREQQIATTLSAIGVIWTNTTDTTFIEDPSGLFVLSPGTGISFGTTASNVGFQITFHWRERPAQGSELAFP